MHTFLELASPARSCSSIAVPSVPSSPGHLYSRVDKINTIKYGSSKYSADMTNRSCQGVSPQLHAFWNWKCAHAAGSTTQHNSTQQ